MSRVQLPKPLFIGVADGEGFGNVTRARDLPKAPRPQKATRGNDAHFLTAPSYARYCGARSCNLTKTKTDNRF